jgi:hypothetical protein
MGKRWGHAGDVVTGKSGETRGEERPFSASAVAVFASGARRMFLGVKGSPVRIRPARAFGERPDLVFVQVRRFPDVRAPRAWGTWLGVVGGHNPLEWPRTLYQLNWYGGSSSGVGRLVICGRRCSGSSPCGPAQTRGDREGETWLRRDGSRVRLLWLPQAALTAQVLEIKKPRASYPARSTRTVSVDARRVGLLRSVQLMASTSEPRASSPRESRGAA